MWFFNLYNWDQSVSPSFRAEAAKPSEPRNLLRQMERFFDSDRSALLAQND